MAAERIVVEEDGDTTRVWIDDVEIPATFDNQLATNSIHTWCDQGGYPIVTLDLRARNVYVNGHHIKGPELGPKNA